jgi:signal transduction histidine kinase
MFKIKTFRGKLILYFLPAFLIFVGLVLGFQYNREKEFKRLQLNHSMLYMSDLTHNYIEQNKIFTSKNWESLDSLIPLYPLKEIRLTIIAPNGNVLYDSEVKDITTMENHLSRSEVVNSIGNPYGTDIRLSHSTTKSYYYFSKRYENYFVRIAAVYNQEIISLLQTGRLFLLFILLLFITVWVVFMFVSNQFVKTINQLKVYTTRLRNGQEVDINLNFSNDEFGSIAQQVVEFYDELKTAKDNLTIEKDKLYKHLYALNEGVAFFTSDKKKILANNHFIQNINTIADYSTISAEQVFFIEEFRPIVEFIEQNLSAESTKEQVGFVQKEMAISKSGSYFNVQCVIFQDNSFEIVITDVSKLERRKLLKQEITSNIAHELRTPVAAILGFIETLRSSQVSPDKQQLFLERAYTQANRLNELVDDISLLNKIDENKDYYNFEDVNVKEVISEAKGSFSAVIDEKKIMVTVLVDENLKIKANRSLLFSVFHNLFDNAIKYGGDNLDIKIENYLEDEQYYYFSFSDNGQGVPETHLARLFERFYRVDSGRSRKTGGTGLGLAIVKNAVQLHKGEISVRNKKDGGLEFLFNLPKEAKS